MKSQLGMLLHIISRKHIFLKSRNSYQFLPACFNHVTGNFNAEFH